MCTMLVFGFFVCLFLTGVQVYWGSNLLFGVCFAFTYFMPPHIKILSLYTLLTLNTLTHWHYNVQMFQLIFLPVLPVFVTFFCCITYFVDIIYCLKLNIKQLVCCFICE